MRPSTPVHVLMTGLLFAFLTAPEGVQAAAPRAFEDAALRAVQFVDNNEGWAVGDEGAVWHTIDGGQSWERQPTATRASLRSLHFVNPYTGWVVGREELPNGGGSVGVLLHTEDGGLRWRHVLSNAMPGLNVVRFVDGKIGYLAGDGSDQYPSGVFMTADGGHSWQPVTGPRSTSWLAGEFNADGGVVAGAWNRLGRVGKDRIGLADIDPLGGRSLCGLLLSGRRAFAVGQGGLVLRSEGTAGATWGFVDLGLSHDVESAWDFHAVHGSGKQIWAVGRPGSAVLHSSDGGNHWQIVRTGQPLPLNGVWFQDESHGWAVGELGTILATTNGGKTWQVQHRGGQRAAVLCVHARAAGLAPDTLAHLGAEDAYLVAALRVTRSDPATASPARAAEGERFAEAVRQAGGAASESLWQFPVSSHLAAADRDRLLQAWDRVHDDHAADQLLAQIVLAIRMWQPDVILTDCPEKVASAPAADTLVAEAVREAFRVAADPKAYPEQLSTLGLAPRACAKAYACADGRTAPVSLDLTAVSRVLESTYRDFAAPFAAMLAEGPVSLPAMRGYRLLAGRLPAAETHRDLMEGITLAAGSLARRPTPPVPEENSEADKTLRKQAALQSVAEAPPGLANPDRLLGQLGPMLSELPDDRAAPAAFAVATQYVRTGQWELARETFLLMAERYPAHPLTADAYRWLLRHASSSEARRRSELGQFLVLRHDDVVVSNQGSTLAGAKPKRGEPLTEVTPRRQQVSALLVDKDGIRKWYQGSLDLETRLAAFGPLLADDPSVQFCLQAARRNLGDFEGAKRWYERFAAKQPDGPWRNAAAAELWLLNRTGLPPKPVANCRFTETRPFLDGKLDDDCWRVGPPMTLKSAAGDTLKDYPTEVRMAYDREFLYVALRCFHPASRHVEPTPGRRHDEDLRAFDRVSLMLDLDRDYSTAFHFQVDQRGHVAEDCWGDKTWNPNWYVAVHSEPTVWVIEAAIPLSALTGDAVTNGKAWAFNVVRTVPGEGVQAFSLPAEVPEVAMRPEGMGLLMFAQNPGQTATASAAKPMPRVP